LSEGWEEGMNPGNWPPEMSTGRFGFPWTLEHTKIQIGAHHPRKCFGKVCALHNRSQHAMRGFRQHWRGDRRIIERVCPHEVGHPDPDDLRINCGIDAGVHGCDGCCRREDARR